jgi:hypothetical protein
MWRLFYGSKRMMRSADAPAQGRPITLKEFRDEASAWAFIAKCRENGVPADTPVQVKQTASA